MAKKSQLEYYWSTVYNIALKEYDISKNKLTSIDNFLKYVGNESKELMSKSIEVNRDTWVASVALSDIKPTGDGSNPNDLSSSHITSSERIQVLDTTSAMEDIDYSNTEGSEVDNTISRSIVSKVNEDLGFTNMDINDRINIKLQNYREITDNSLHKDLIDRILNKKPLKPDQKSKFLANWKNMIINGIGIDKEELSKILEDDNYKDILNESQRRGLLELAQYHFNKIDAKQKNNYSKAKKREMNNLYRNTSVEYERAGLFNDWSGGVEGKLKGSSNKLFKTDGANKLQFDENVFDEIISGLDLGTDEESKKKIKNMTGDLRNAIKELVGEYPNMDKSRLIDEAMGRVFGTYYSLSGDQSTKNDLKSVDKADEALIMRAIRDKGLDSRFETGMVKSSFEDKFKHLDASVGAKKLDKYLSFDSGKANIASGLNEEESAEAKELKESFEKYSEMTYEQLIKLASAMDSIANSQDTASIINNYYMSNGTINVAENNTTNEL